MTIYAAPGPVRSWLKSLPSYSNVPSMPRSCAENYLNWVCGGAVHAYIIHKSNLTLAWLTHNLKFDILFQSAYLPWLNDIEKFWKQLQHHNQSPITHYR
jgi:hypothetical protein